MFSSFPPCNCKETDIINTFCLVEWLAKCKWKDLSGKVFFPINPWLEAFEITWSVVGIVWNGDPQMSVSLLACHFSTAECNYGGLYWHHKYESTGGIHFHLFNWRNERSCDMELTWRICQAIIKSCNNCDLGVRKGLIKRKKFLWYRSDYIDLFYS